MPRSRSRSRSGSPQRYRSASRSRSPVRDDRRRSPSPRRNRRSRTPEFRGRERRGYGGGGGRRGGAWAPNRSRENPDPSRCVGVFNLSLYTTEKDLKEVFGKYGDLDKVELVYDHPTGRSRGFGFIYFVAVGDATAARDELNGSDLDGHKIRVDFSITKRAHTPTPGQYMGGPGDRRPSRSGPSSGGGRFGGDRGDFRRRESYRDGYGGGRDRKRSPSPRRRRSPSPRYDRHRSRSRSY